ncbi:hypothetical protein K7432_000369 [Basidiobolus ranarum]|uniref:Transmembrane protein 107 n=1 Tax=Basidiobolus ranarum TaxID=34480 RepID=A0ABR2X4Q8_9FUNG
MRLTARKSEQSYLFSFIPLHVACLISQAGLGVVALVLLLLTVYRKLPVNGMADLHSDFGEVVRYFAIMCHGLNICVGVFGIFSVVVAEISVQIISVYLALFAIVWDLTMMILEGVTGEILLPILIGIELILTIFGIHSLYRYGREIRGVQTNFEQYRRQMAANAHIRKREKSLEKSSINVTRVYIDNSSDSLSI